MSAFHQKSSTLGAAIPVEKTIATGDAVDLVRSLETPRDIDHAMAGWSGDSRYLMVERITVADAAPTDGPSPDANGAFAGRERSSGGCERRAAPGRRFAEPKRRAASAHGAGGL